MKKAIDKSLNKKVGAKIRYLRTRKKIKQSMLASQIGITAATLSKIEAGLTDITITRLMQIADSLKIDAGKLLPGNSEKPSDLEIAFTAMEKRVANREEEISILQTKLIRLYEEVKEMENYFARLE